MDLPLRQNMDNDQIEEYVATRYSPENVSSPDQVSPNDQVSTPTISNNTEILFKIKHLPTHEVNTSQVYSPIYDIEFQQLNITNLI